MHCSCHMNSARSTGPEKNENAASNSAIQMLIYFPQKGLDFIWNIKPPDCSPKEFFILVA